MNIDLGQTHYPLLPPKLLTAKIAGQVGAYLTETPLQMPNPIIPIPKTTKMRGPPPRQIGVRENNHVNCTVATRCFGKNPKLLMCGSQV